MMYLFESDDTILSASRMSSGALAISLASTILFLFNLWFIYLVATGRLGQYQSIKWPTLVCLGIATSWAIAKFLNYFLIFNCQTQYCNEIFECIDSILLMVLMVAHLLYQQQILRIFSVMNEKLTPTLFLIIRIITICLFLHCLADYTYVKITKANSDFQFIGQVIFPLWMVIYENSHCILILKILGRLIKKKSQQVALNVLKRYTITTMICGFLVFMVYLATVILGDEWDVAKQLAMDWINVHLFISILFNVKMKNVQFPQTKVLKCPSNQAHKEPTIEATRILSQDDQETRQIDV